MMDEELQYKVLKALNENAEMSQRDLAKQMDLSLGKINFVVKALMKKGMIKARNFKNSKNKIAYFYQLTPNGIEKKANLTMKFLARKMKEYDELKREIRALEKEVSEEGLETEGVKTALSG